MSSPDFVMMAPQGAVDDEASARQTADGLLGDRLTAVESKIPTEASASNKLADKAHVAAAIAAAKNSRFAVVEELPASGEENVIYLVHAEDGEENDVFDEYIWLVGSGGVGAWEKIASTRIDLSGYATTAAMNTALSGKVDKETGKGLSSNDYTTAEKEKLAGIAAGAEVNVVATVKVNGTALTPTDKAVNISVPTAPSDIGAVAANTAITGATKCKVTYDAKGLVTGGADLAASDIPTLTSSKIGDFGAEAAKASYYPFDTTAAPDGDDVLTVTPFTSAQYTAQSGDDFVVDVGALPQGVAAGTKVRDCILAVDATANTPSVTFGQSGGTNTFAPANDDNDNMACEADAVNVYYISEYAPNAFLVARQTIATGGGT